MTYEFTLQRANTYMRRSTARLLAAAILALAATATNLGCSRAPHDASADSAPQQGSIVGEADRLPIQEAVFRMVLPSVETLDSLGEVYFLAVTDAEGNLEDPPSELVQLFSDELGKEVKPVSLAKETPQVDQRYDEPFYRDAESGQAGRLFYVSQPRWVDETTVEVEAGSRAAPIAAWEATYVLRKVDGQWRVFRVREGWVS
ncbi:hypothetical protein [Aeoliella sp.]|uniref:hypothetical protein n=1 Tax=Aeoliella sp. TaxID=2795800 RepID=UPI003CCBEDBD